MAEFIDRAPTDVAPPEDEEAVAQVTYTVRVEGLGPLGLNRRFRDLSALFADAKRRAPAVQVRLRAEADAELLERLLRSEGYYDGSATVAVAPSSGKTDTLAVTLTASPGDRYKLGEILVTGDQPEPIAIAREGLPLVTGQPIIAAEVLTAEASAAARLPENGYPFASFSLRRIELDSASHAGRYELPLVAGPKSGFGGFQVEGDLVFDARHIRVLSRFKPGQLYDSRRVDDLRQALVATSLLSTVALEPIKTGEIGVDGLERVDIRVRQTRAPPRTLAASIGYGTGEGYKATATWTHRNLFPPEGALILNVVGGTQEQRLATTFRRSNAGQRDRTLQFAAEARREDRDAYNLRAFSLSGRLSRESTPIWQKRWTYAVGAELIASDESRFREITQDRKRDTYFIGALPGQLGYDVSDNLLNPTRGFRVTGRLSPEASIQGGVDGYLRSLLDVSAYMPAGDSIVLAGRTRLGSIVGVPRDSIAPSRRLYSGGGGSVRGFGFQELGPRDANNDPIGGRSQFEAAFEVRYRFGDFGIVPFVDAGQVYERSAPSFEDIRFGAGIGVRYYTNFGPMRIDVATPLGRRPDESKIGLYISIGQAF